MSQEIIVDTVDQIESDDIIFFTPNHFNSARFLASNIFDKATIKNTPIESIQSPGLLGMYNSLKPNGTITVILNQPIAIMLPYDAKQVEANLRLVGFENIETKDTEIIDEKTGQVQPSMSIEGVKPIKSGEQSEIKIEVVKSTKFADRDTVKSRERESKREKDRQSSKGKRGGAAREIKVNTVTKSTTEETKETEEDKVKQPFKTVRVRGRGKEGDMATTTTITTTVEVVKGGGNSKEGNTTTTTTEKHYSYRRRKK